VIGSGEAARRKSRRCRIFATSKHLRFAQALQTPDLIKFHLWHAWMFEDVVNSAQDAAMLVVFEK